MHNNYKRTLATVTGKAQVNIVSAPYNGFFSSYPGGEKLRDEYRAFFLSESGNVFEDDFNYSFWMHLKVGDKVLFEKGQASIVTSYENDKKTPESSNSNLTKCEKCCAEYCVHCGHSGCSSL